MLLDLIVTLLYIAVSIMSFFSHWDWVCDLILENLCISCDVVSPCLWDSWNFNWPPEFRLIIESIQILSDSWPVIVDTSPIAQNLPFQKILSSTLVSFCLPETDLTALDHSPDLFAHRFYVLVLFFCFSYSCVWQTKLASYLVNFWAHYKIVCFKVKRVLNRRTTMMPVFQYYTSFLSFFAISE